MSAPTINLIPDNRGLIEAYQRILDHDPAKWDLYPHLAALFPTEAEQSHIYLQGAWRALERGSYEAAQNLSSAAESVYGRTFRSRLIDIELLKKQGQSVAIPKKLLEISDTFKRKNLPAEEVKAYKRLAILDPSPAYYQRVMILYTQINKVQKASTWASKLAKMTPSTSLPPKTAQAIEKPNPTKAKSTVSALVPVKQSATLAPKPSQPIEAPVPSFLKPALSESKIATPALISKPMQPQLPDIAFGKALWGKYFGDIGVEPPLPPDIDKILNSSCPIWPNKKVRETHLLILVPQSVNGKPLTLKTLGELVQKPLRGNATKYGHFYLGQYTDPKAPQSHWVLISRDVIPGSRNKSYPEQYAQVVILQQKTKLPYEVPTVLDAAICIFMEYVRTGIYLYRQDPLTYSRCQEKYDLNWRLAFGGFSSKGLDIFSSEDNSNAIGVAVLWNFSNQVNHIQISPSIALPEERAEAKQSSPIHHKALASKYVKLPYIAFGKALWAKYFGDVGEEPPLPPNIEKILNSSCPFWPEKKVRETHLLVLVPKTVTITKIVKGDFFSRNKTKTEILQLNLKTLGELVQNPLQRNATKYSYFNLGKYTDPPNPKSHWALMSRDVIPGSSNKSYQAQQAQITTLQEKTKLPYAVPTVLDAAVCIFMEYVRTDTRLYENEPWTFTRCQEKYDDNLQLGIGGFSQGGLHVYENDGLDYCGVAAMRKFF